MLPPTPTIEIHLAQDEHDDDQLEIRPPRSPYSPKLPSPMAYVDSDADDFRPVHLLPPPSVSPVARPKLPSPPPADKKGIDQERFAQLLKSCRERAAMKHGRKESLELRKQVTLKAHTTKALERRALFLSKIQSPPSPGAANMPVTPPESPAVFHFTLPSPGMQSPLAVFESLAQREKVAESDTSTVEFPRDPTSPTGNAGARKGWVEEVDFRARVRRNSIRNGTAPIAELDLAVPRSTVKQDRRASSGRSMPSLDQITARLAKAGALPTQQKDVTPSVSAVGGAKKSVPPLDIGKVKISGLSHRRTPSSPLATSPVFTSVPEVTVEDEDNAEPPAPATRLPAFLQKRPSTEETTTPAVAPTPPSKSSSHPATTGESVRLSAPPALRRRPTNPAPPRLPPSQPFQVRAMPTRLPLSSSTATAETRKQRGLDMVEKLRRRSSAPAALPPSEGAAARKDSHRVLTMKGGF
ncbi:hypothetical protein FRB99_007663 [Tulasnella sp. 403]|nr:hypothetical protein FRB99_007663 [Tulasnella sp. 403]